MSTVAPVSLPLLEGLRCRPGASEQVVQDALTRYEAGRRIARWAASRYTTRDHEQTYTKERSNKRRKVSKKRPAPQEASAVTVADSSWEHWIFQTLRSPALSVRQVSLRILLKGSITPDRWKLRNALVSLIDSYVVGDAHDPSPEYAVQLVGMLSHIVCEDHPWKDPVAAETDMELVSFVAAGGLRWVTRSILRLAQALPPLLESANHKARLPQSNTIVHHSGATLEAIQYKLCLMVHLCYRLLLYAAVPGPSKSSKEQARNSSTETAPAQEAQETSSSARRRRASSVSSKASDKSTCQQQEEEKRYKELAAARLATLRRLHQHFWTTNQPATTTNNNSLSPLACLICANEVLRDADPLAAKTRRSLHSLYMLARLVDPNATVSVQCAEEHSAKKKAKPRDSRTFVFASGAPSLDRSATAAAAMAQAVSAAVDVFEGGEDEDIVMETIAEEDDDDDDEGDELMEVDEDDNEQVQETEDGSEGQDVDDEEEEDEFNVEEEDGDEIVDDDEEEDEDDDDDDDDEGEGEEAGEEVAEDGGIGDVVRHFERRLIDIGDSDTLQADAEEGLALDRDRSQTASTVPSATGKDRSRTLIQASMQVLAAQHPPAAAGALHGSSIRNGRVTRRSQGTSKRPLLSLSAEQSLIKRICNVVKPPRKPLNLKLFMRRAPTQEEFFRGSLTRNPVPLSTLMPSAGSSSGNSSNEPTVRDLRKHIADDLQMSDSAELIELLVANQILDMDLKLRVVQQVLWKNYLTENSSAAFSSSLLSGQSAPSFFSTGSGLSMIFSSSGG